MQDARRSGAAGATAKRNKRPAEAGLSKWRKPAGPAAGHPPPPRNPARGQTWNWVKKLSRSFSLNTCSVRL